MSDKWDLGEFEAAAAEDMPDDLPAIGAAYGEPGQVSGFRDALYRRTARVLRRRVWMRRTAMGLAFLLAYGGGAGTVWLGSVDDAAAPPPVATAAPAPPARSTVEELLGDPDAMGRYLAHATPGEQMRFYREAGDWYLNAAGNPADAVRSYRHLLWLETRHAALGDVNDETWLLASLRRDHERGDKS